MTLDEFWSLIESTDTDESQVYSLTEKLKLLESEDIVGFEVIFKELCFECHKSDLWAAAYLIMGECTNENFNNFKCWLIAQGKEAFSNVLKNPEFLADYIPQEYEITGEALDLEELQHVSLDAYYLKMNGSIGYDESLETEFYSLFELSRLLLTLPDIVLDWTDEENLKNKFPKLWERFGENPLF